jgi:membrane protease YdiL (CAAX protease family)
VDAYYAVATAPARPPVTDLLAGVPKAPRASRTVLACIGVGALAQGLFWLLTRSPSVEPEAAIRYALVTTLGVYCVVSVVLVRHVASENVRLAWRGTWPAWLCVLTGLASGGLLALGLLHGHLSGTPGDPRVAMLVSEGDVPHVLLTVLLVVVLAPLTEEVLFRGLLCESLSGNRRFAVWVSAAAFAAWHLSPKALVYYTLMGAFLGGLYLRRGLAGSIAAHAAFNGLLAFAAVSYALTPGATVAADGLVVRAPHGWHAVSSHDLYLRGPSAGEVHVVRIPGVSSLNPQVAADRLAAGVLDGPGYHVRAETARTVRLPIGMAVRVRVVSDGRDGDVVLFAANGKVYAAELASGGSPRVRKDFETILRDLRATPSR